MMNHITTPDERIAELWRQGLNTHEIAETMTRDLGEPVAEHHVYRVLARRESKGGAE